eukprot:9979093-Ditylum_brightwellii.AAC.1
MSYSSEGSRGVRLQCALLEVKNWTKSKCAIARIEILQDLLMAVCNTMYLIVEHTCMTRDPWYMTNIGIRTNAKDKHQH